MGSYEALFMGYLTGLSLVVLIGPVVLMLLSITLEQGQNSGMCVAFGIAISDLLIVSLFLTLGSNVVEATLSTPWLAALGGLILAGIGTRMLLNRSEIALSGGQFRFQNNLVALWRGFAVNFFNPFVFVVWLGIVSYAKKNTLDGLATHLYLGAVLLGILTLDLGKVVLANRLKPYLAPKYIRRFHYVCGVILILFGLRLGYVGLTH